MREDRVQLLELTILDLRRFFARIASDERYSFEQIDAVARTIAIVQAELDAARARRRDETGP